MLKVPPVLVDKTLLVMILRCLRLKHTRKYCMYINVYTKQNQCRSSHTKVHLVSFHWHKTYNCTSTHTCTLTCAWLPAHTPAHSPVRGYQHTHLHTHLKFKSKQLCYKLSNSSKSHASILLMRKWLHGLHFIQEYIL